MRLTHRDSVVGVSNTVEQRCVSKATQKELLDCLLDVAESQPPITELD